MLVIIALLIGWPLVVYFVGPSLELILPTLVIYAVVSWSLRFWAPMLGALSGVLVGAVAMCGSSPRDTADGLALMLLCAIAGTLLGWYIQSMLHLDAPLAAEADASTAAVSTAASEQQSSPACAPDARS